MIEHATISLWDLELAHRQCGALASMGSAADCYDNSMMEWFFARIGRGVCPKFG